MLLWLLACEPKPSPVVTETADTGVDCIDEDGDGAGGCGGGYPDRDCDDHDPSRSPDAQEICDGIDNDCDNTVDEGVTTTFYVDVDGDGFGDPNVSVEGCEITAGWVENADDCDDTDADVSPAGVEVCDGLDQDCDGTADEDATDAPSGYADADGDGFGDAATPVVACDAIRNADDCDDTDPTVTVATSRWPDADGDGYGDGAAVVACTGALVDGDCDDADAARHPGATEAWGDGVDQDCDGHADETSLSDVDVILPGEAAGDGVQAVDAGDLDGDGIDDLAVGAYAAGSGAGAAYVLLGPLDGTETLAAADVRIDGATTDDHAGSDVAVVPDVDGDGIDDLFVGGFRDGTNGSEAGAAYLFSGPALDATDTRDAFLRLWGETSGDQAGGRVEGADLDGDGVGDLLVGAWYGDHGAHDAGAAYVVYGPASGDMDLGAADAVVAGGQAFDFAGIVVNAHGDFDGDGTPDLIVGAWSSDDGGTDGGGAYVFSGPVRGEGTLADADAVVAGTSTYDWFGYAADAGDVDGDGHDDLVVGAYYIGGGEVYVFPGPLAASATDRDAVTTIEGTQDYGYVGSAITVLPGTSRVIVGAYREDATAGNVYGFDGLSPGTWSTTDADMRWTGASMGVSTYAGAYLGDGGDLDDDGVQDILVGADGYDGTGRDAGVAWVIFGP